MGKQCEESGGERLRHAKINEFDTMLRQPHHRRAAIALWLLIALPVGLIFGGVALYAAAANTMGIQATHTTDGAALAAARTLVSDELLRARLYSDISGINDPPVPTLLTRARENAIAFGELNFINGKKITFTPNTSNAQGGDIVFGFVDHYAFQADIVRADLTPGPLYADNVKGINAVEVVLRRLNADALPVWGPMTLNLAQGATAILDGDVVGFVPRFNTQSLPLMPFGITATTWTNAIAAATPDTQAYDQTSNSFIPGSDNLPEITVRIVAQPPPGYVVTPVTDDANTYPLTIGTVSPAGLTAQVTNGVSKPEYDNFFAGYGLFELTGPAPAQLTIPASVYYDPAQHASLLAAFQGEVPSGTTSPGKPRVWPLVNAAPSGAPTEASARNFVAARVVAANATTVTATDGMNVVNVDAIDIVLQPTMLESPTTVTDYARRTNVSGPNHYIAKVRLTK